jgi:hypothetical protein
VADGTQNNARFPNGSAVLSFSRSATVHVASMTAKTVAASDR